MEILQKGSERVFGDESRQSHACCYPSGAYVYRR